MGEEGQRNTRWGGGKYTRGGVGGQMHNFDAWTMTHISTERYSYRGGDDLTKESD